MKRIIDAAALARSADGATKRHKHNGELKDTGDNSHSKQQWEKVRRRKMAGTGKSRVYGGESDGEKGAAVTGLPATAHQKITRRHELPT